MPNRDPQIFIWSNLIFLAQQGQQNAHTKVKLFLEEHNTMGLLSHAKFLADP